MASSDTAPSEVAAEVPFHDLCSLMERVSKVSGLEKKKKIFSSFLEKWREEHLRLHPTDADTTKDTFYSAMRLLLPHIDRVRPAYGLKEVALAKHYIDILSIAKESTDAQKLLHYRAPHTAKQDAGDFASVAYFVLRNRCPEKGSLTVAQVNQHLDDLAQSNVKKDRPGVKKALQLLLRNTSAVEQKWLIRIILKELKMGMNESSVFSVFHPDAMDLFTVCSSLEKVCSDLRDPKTCLNEASIAYFTPFRPMLGQRANLDQVLKLMDNGLFYLETKFDGDRMQLHKRGNEYRYFSRSSKDYTTSFGSGPYEGSFTPQIHNSFNSKVDSCILDGEMVGWDAETDSFLPKGDHVDVKTLGRDEDSGIGIQQCFVAFDVLMVNDTNFANRPLKDRAEQLKKLFRPVKGYLHLVDRREGTTKEEVVAALNEAIDRREEGLMVKNPSSMYCPDKRKGSGWIKIKPEYVDSLSDQLDVLIIGGYYGEGHRRGGLVSHFLCGVAVPPELPGDKPSLFYSFCKVGSGYTLTELRDLGLKLKDHWRPFDTRRPPDNIILAPGFKEKPDLWLPPAKSCIVQLRAAEIVASDRYKTGCTLRFPRVEKVRNDKEYFDCMTTEELDQLRMLASGRLAHSHYEDTDAGPAPKKRKVVSSRVERPKGVAPQFRQTDTSDIQEVSTMFAGREFCVVNGSQEFSKEEMERKIVEKMMTRALVNFSPWLRICSWLELRGKGMVSYVPQVREEQMHGGSLVQNPSSTTFCVLVDKLIVRANNIISTGLYDVVNTVWLKECLATEKCLPFLPRHMLHTGPATTTKFSALYDKYGDSYTDHLTDQDIREIFKKVTEKNRDDFRVSQEEIAFMESRYFPNDSPRGLFRQCRVYLDKYLEVENADTAIEACSLDQTGLDLRCHGAKLTNKVDEQVTHIIFDTNDFTRVPELRRMEREHAKKHHFVTAEWVRDSIESQFLKNERFYEPKV